MVFNPSLEQKQRGNQDQQQSHGGLDEIVDSGAVNVAQVDEKSHAQVRAGNAARRQGQNDFSPHRAFAQMHDAGGNLGEEVEHRVAADRDNRRNAQAKDEHGQQQHAATQPG